MSGIGANISFACVLKLFVLLVLSDQFWYHSWLSWNVHCYHTYVLLHLVKSSCPNSVNPFSTLFSADIQHNCPILFCTCRPYFPPWLAFRFSIKKWLHLHFQGKWPLSPSSFEQLSFSLRFILQNEWKCYGSIWIWLSCIPDNCRWRGWRRQCKFFWPV